MKKVLFALAALVMGASLNAQTVVFSENFDGMTQQSGYIYTLPSTWTTIGDNLPNASDYSAWGNSWIGINFADQGLTAGSCSYTNNQTACDRWLITPSIVVPNTLSNCYLTFEAMGTSYNGQSGPIYPEALMVLVSTTTTDKNSFTILHDYVPLEAGFNSYMLDLSNYYGDTIYVAFVNHGTDGYYCAIDNVKIGEMAAADMAITGITVPKYAAQNGSISFGGMVKNLGQDNLTSMVATYVIDGTDSVRCTISNLNLAYGATAEFTHTTPYQSATLGRHTVEMIVSAPNGSETYTAQSLSGSFYTYDASMTFPRTVLVEQFTGNKCGYCPSGADRINQAIGSRSDALWITHHAGYNQDALSNAHSTPMTFFYNDNTYAPAVMFDRTNLSGDPGPVMSVPAASGITQYFQVAKETPTFCQLNPFQVSYDAASHMVTGTLTGTINGEFDEMTRLMIYVVEDSLSLQQADYYNGTSSNSYMVDYIHNHTVRGSLTGIWGTTITPDAQGNFTYELNCNLATTLPTQNAPYITKGYNSKLVAFLYRYNQNDPNDCGVMNAVKSNYLGSLQGIEAANEIESSVYPNPASDFAVVEAGSVIRDITVLNALGQVVYTNNNVNAEHFVINTRDMSKGIYMVNIHTDKGVASHKIVVVK